MNQIIYLSSEFVTETCCNCGLVFAMLKDYKKERLKDHKSFCCPAGHSQHYVSKSDEEKLKEELTHCQADRDFWMDGHDMEKDKRKSVERSRSSFKGVITKMRKKTRNGRIVKTE